MSEFLDSLLKRRGLKTKKEIKKFLYPKWEDNYDPFLFLDMKKIVKRIWQAVKKKEKILIFSDYDTDGIPGGAILAEFFKKIKYKNFINFIPNRNNDGYGLPKKMAERVRDEIKPDLVITVDCGITDVEGALVFKKAKIDLIITDHHLPNGKLPDALGIINHKVKLPKGKKKYPEQVLSGAGIAFKLVQALVKTSKPGLIIEGWEKWLLDLVVIATVCDMVPLTGENRILVKYGQKVLNKTLRPGLKRIIEKARLNKENISTGDIGFMIGPRLNAATRLDDPIIAFTALAGEKEIAIFAAEELEKLNNRRKYLLAKIMKEVWKRLGDRSLDKVIVIGNKKWPLGMLGLIAGKIADKYKRPSFAWGGERLRGSCRGGGEYSVFDLMEKTKKEFIQFGGHAQSGGFEVAFDKIHSLEKKLSKNLSKTARISVEKTEVEAEVTLDDVNMDNYRDIEKLEPFGVGNPQPIFLIKDVEVFKVNHFGKHQEHLELIFKNSKNFNIKAIAFYYTDKFPQKIKEKQVINLTCSFELNTWNGNSSLRLKIIDFS